MTQTINERVEALRAWMQQQGVQAFITPSTDPHQGEYTPDHWHTREWISGFNGSAGTAVVTSSKSAGAALWTDNRYFLQAADQLHGTPFQLMKIGLENTPSIGAWLVDVLNKGDAVGVDAACWSLSSYTELESELTPGGIRLCNTGDPYADIWTDRPSLPLHPVEIQPLQFAGEPASSKITRIREALASADYEASEGLLISALDEVAWTLNLRGADVEYNPVFVSYLLIPPHDSPTLFIHPDKLSPEVTAYLQGEGVMVAPYDQAPIHLRSDVTPVRLMKCMKNETEIRGYRSAMVKWMKWVVPAVQAGGQTELSLAAQLEAFRAEQPLFRGLSFGSIMAYAAHGAIIHYEPSLETDIPVEPRGLLLIDSGGQYQDGTTDITRTIPLGPLTDEERQDYTLVLRGFIDLGRAVFPRGSYGSQLDVLARAAMWQYGTNYLHGTGHGVGAFLNVHQGPHQFRMNHMPTLLLPGMTITDEPGIYIAGSHGVRHENTMLVVNHSEGRTFGPYYTFEHLTLAPIPTSPIVREMLTQEEADWLNAYHRMVFERLSPALDEDHRNWLLQATQPI